MLILKRIHRGPGFAGGVSSRNRSIGVFEEKFPEILEYSEFVWHGCSHGAVGGVFCDATNQELSKSSCAKPCTARHQYGLQIAEGMVTFFESYERELEKYWTKTLFFQLS